MAVFTKNTSNENQKNNLIIEAREKTAENSFSLIHKSMKLFEYEEYEISCFLAMTAIEEAGKLFQMRLFSLYGTEEDYKSLEKFLRNHIDKVIEAAVQSLFINCAADSRHKRHPESKALVTDGIIILARSKKWMKIRNFCLYTDIEVELKNVIVPFEKISKEHAYYFICMALEILAEQAESAYGSNAEGRDVSKSYKFLNDCIETLNEFMDKWKDTVNIYQLDFLKDPDNFIR
jgi:AbiV family abortive infection protein